MWFTFLSRMVGGLAIVSLTGGHAVCSVIAGLGRGVRGWSVSLPWTKKVFLHAMWCLYTIEVKFVSKNLLMLVYWIDKKLATVRGRHGPMAPCLNMSLRVVLVSVLLKSVFKRCKGCHKTFQKCNKTRTLFGIFIWKA